MTPEQKREAIRDAEDRIAQVLERLETEVSGKVIDIAWDNRSHTARPVHLLVDDKLAEEIY